MLRNDEKKPGAPSVVDLEKDELPAAVIVGKIITECNNAFISLMNSSEEKIKGAPFESILATFAADDGTLRAIPVILQGTPPPQTVYLKPEGGYPVCASMAVEAMTGKDGESLIATFSVLNAEVFERQKDELFRSRATSRLWHVAVFDHDHMTNKIYMSPLYREIYGVETEDELSFENAGKFIHPDDRDMEAVLKAHDPEGTGLFDKAFRIIRPNGEIRWIHSRSRTFFDTVDGKRQGVRTTGAIVDFTDEYMLKKALEENKQKLADILDSLPSIVLGVDHRGTVTQWNKLADMESDVADAAPEERRLERLFPMLVPKMAWIQKAMTNRQPLEITRIPHSRGDATSFYNVSIIPLNNTAESDTVIRIDDITEEIRIEQMLVQSEKLLSVGGLAAGMAHEINNPLFGIIQIARFVQEKLDTQTNENQAAARRLGIPPDKLRVYLEERNIPELIDSIRDAGDRASTIVRNMLGFVRVSDDQHTRCDITNLMDVTIGLLMSDFDMKTNYAFRNIKISREYTEEFPETICDSGKLQQVFLNILKNAGQAMFCAKVPVPEIKIGVYGVPDYLRIEIEDNGPGVPDEISRRIFEPFFTTKPRGEGTGLGLSISYSIIVKEHKGSMHVERGAAGGSRFVIDLPRMTARISATRVC